MSTASRASSERPLETPQAPQSPETTPTPHADPAQHANTAHCSTTADTHNSGDADTADEKAPRPSPQRPIRTPIRVTDAVLITAAITGIKLLVLSLVGIRAGHSVSWALSRWDAQFYMGIAEGGYFHPTSPIIDGPPWERSLAFFPAIPGIIDALTRLGFNPLTAGVVFSQCCSLLACAGAMALASRMGAGRAGQAMAAVAILGAPLAITMAMPYSEALFLALALWALVAMIDERYLQAGVLCCVAGLARLTAVDLIAVLILVVAWRMWRTRRLNIAGIVAVLISPIGLFSYLAYANHHLADAGGYFGIQKQGWHSAFDFGAATVRFLMRVAFDPEANVGYFLSALIIVGAVVVLLTSLQAAFRGQLPWIVWLFGAAIIANVLLSDGIMHSRPRLLLPAYVLLFPWVVRWRPRTAVMYVLVSAWVSAYFLMVFPWAI